MIAVFNASAPDTNYLRYLNSVQVSSLSIQIIVVLTNDLGGSSTIQELKKLQNDFDMLVAAPLHVKKNSANGQHPLFAWLTSAALNGHFDNDVALEELYIISEKGTLYSVLAKETPVAVINKVISGGFKK